MRTLDLLGFRTLLVTLPLAVATAAMALGACSAKQDEATPLLIEDGGDIVDTGRVHPTDGSLTKPPPTARDGGSDALPPPPPPTPKDGGGGSDARTGDADIPDADPGGATGTPIDPVDKMYMPTYGVDVGLCTDLSIPSGTGLCKTNTSGFDFVEGCVSPKAYILDCARYESPKSIRSICTDNHTTNVGCHLLFNMGTIDSFEKGQTANAVDEKHKCPSNWEGYGYCSGNFVRMCVNGKDWALDCTIYNNSTFTYTCGKSTLSGNLTCL